MLYGDTFYAPYCIVLACKLVQNTIFDGSFSKLGHHPCIKHKPLLQSLLVHLNLLPVTVLLLNSYNKEHVMEVNAEYFKFSERDRIGPHLNS